MPASREKISKAKLVFKEMPALTRIELMVFYIDGDACPVKAEVYRVARRYEIKVYVVANCAVAGAVGRFDRARRCKRRVRRSG